MNRTAIAQELVKVAKELVSAVHVGTVRKTWWEFTSGVEVWWEATVHLADPDADFSDPSAEYLDEKAEMLRTISSDLNRVKRELGALCGGRIEELEWFESEQMDRPEVKLSYRQGVKRKDVTDYKALTDEIRKLGFHGPMR